MYRSLIQRVQKLEEEVEQLHNSMFQLMPELINISEDVRNEVSSLLAQNDISKEINLGISKNDMMYQFIASNTEKADQAKFFYFRSGLHMMQVLEPIICRKFDNFEKIDGFLDFASGYGRLTRFLLQKLDPQHLWVADIKPGAIQFQQENFGVNGLVSTERPEDLTIEKQFDCIFSGSLFSHLPEESFKGWLKRLSDMLSPQGVIIFTVHDISLLKNTSRSKSNGFIYLQTNEEIGLRSDDKIFNLNQYGTSYVTEAFVRKVIESIYHDNHRYFRYEKAMWKWQDIYIISRNNDDDFSDLNLPEQGTYE